MTNISHPHNDNINKRLRILTKYFLISYLKSIFKEDLSLKDNSIQFNLIQYNKKKTKFQFYIKILLILLKIF